MNIIALDDEPLALSALKDTICQALPEEAPVCFGCAEDALLYAKRSPVDVAFLDIAMDGMSGMELAAKLTELRPTTNIIFVTGYTEYLDKAFELYASGYVKKPVRPKRVLKEMQHLRYPVESRALSKVQKFGPYEFDYHTQRVYCNGRDALLTPKEFVLLSLLATAPGVVFAPEELFQQIWGNEPDGHIDTVKVHISRLRKKLEMDDPDHPSILKQRGGGYYMERRLC